MASSQKEQDKPHKLPAEPRQANPGSKPITGTSHMFIWIKSFTIELYCTSNDILEVCNLSFYIFHTLVRQNISYMYCVHNSVFVNCTSAFQYVSIEESKWYYTRFGKGLMFLQYTGYLYMISKLFSYCNAPWYLIIAVTHTKGILVMIDIVWKQAQFSATVLVFITAFLTFVCPTSIFSTH